MERENGLLRVVTTYMFTVVSLTTDFKVANAYVSVEQIKHTSVADSTHVLTELIAFEIEFK